MKRHLVRRDLLASEVLHSNKSEKICSIYYLTHINLPEKFDKDERSRSTYPELFYSIVAAMSDARELWQLAQSDPNVVSELGRMVFPSSLGEILKAAHLADVHVIRGPRDASRQGLRRISRRYEEF